MSQIVDIEKYVDTVYTNVLARFPSGVLSMTNIFDFVRLCMETAENYKSLSGRHKKELVIRVCHKALEEMILDNVDSDALKVFVDKVVDVLVDNFIDIDLGNLHVNEDCKKRWRKVFPCCS